MAVTIIIVENNRSIAQDLQQRLLKYGYEVVGICASSQEAIQSITTFAPDMIIMNIRLQHEADGIEIAELVQKKYNTPIIYMAETAGHTIPRRAKSTGPFGYIFIPFTDRQIITTLEIAHLRNQFEIEIQDSQRWLSGILNGIADGVVAIDAQRQIRYINQVAQRMIGCTEKEAIGRPIHDILVLIDERTAASIELWSSNNARPETSNSHSAAFEAILVTRAGTKMALEVNMTMLADTGSAGSGMVIAFRDIRKQRETLNVIKRQAARAQTLMKSAEQLNSNLEMSNVLEAICTLANNAIQASGTAVFLLDRKTEIFHSVSTTSEVERLLAYKEGQFLIPADIVNSFISSKKRVALIDDVRGLKDFPYLRLFEQENIHHLVIAGIFQNQELIGILASIFVGDSSPLQEADLEMLKGLSDQAAASITNANLFRQVRMGREHQRRLAKSIVEVQEEERRHIARELHDHLGQLLTGMQFMLESAKRQDGDLQKASLDDIQKTVGDMIGQVREMSLNLRPGMLDDMGLLPTLRWHLEQFTTQTGILVDFHSDVQQERFPPEVETAAYRIVQEALTNVARHAQVKQVFVGLITQDNTLWVEILDKGKGVDLSKNVSKPSSGLGGMQERAGLVGGYVVIESFMNQGTQIVAALPFAGKPLERRKIDRNYPVGR